MKLYLIDGSGFIFRAFHALPPLKSPQGINVGAVYGFANMMVKLLSSLSGDRVLVVFDSGRATFRQDIYPDYKANRPEAPEELIPQFPLFRETCDALDVPYVEYHGVEADDLIATYTRQACEKNIPTTIVSSDKDLMQLVQKGVRMFDPLKEFFYDAPQVIEKLGVPPEKVVDFLALTGDRSDNIPGVPSIGPKTAVELLNLFGNLENILDNVHTLKHSKRREMLSLHADLAQLSKRLVVLKNDVIPPILLKDIPFYIEPKIAKTDLFVRLGFKGLSDRYASLREKEEKPLEFLEGVLYIKDGNTLGDPSGNPHIVTYDLKKQDIDIPESFDDIFLMSYALDTESLSLESLAARYNIFYSKEEEVSVINRLYPKIKQRLFDEHKCTLYERVEKPVVAPLRWAEKTGIKVDTDALSELNKNFEMRRQHLEKEIFNVSGKTFNLASPKQVSSVLFDHLKLPHPKKTKTGSYTTDADILEFLHIQGYVIAEKILDWRGIFKLQTTYVNGLRDAVHTETGRIHTTFLQAGTATGRLSSMNPNLQNIPIRSLDGRKIRNAFVSQDGYRLVSFDYSQIELRLLAHFADIPSLSLAFEKGEDIHQTTASQIFEIPLDQVTSDQRRRAKTINFGIIYGISAYGLSQQLKIAPEEASSLIEAYFKQYPGIKAYKESVCSEARSKGYVETLLKRRCFITGLSDKNANTRHFAERQASNAPLQGSSADIIKRAMGQLFPIYFPHHDRVRLLLQIHDELLFEIHEDDVEAWSSRIQKIMENEACLRVPCPVTVSSGTRWGDLEIIR